MGIIRYDAKQRRVWIAKQRIHHGPVGWFLAVALAKWHPRWAIVAVFWGISDLHDAKLWFKRGSQDL